LQDGVCSQPVESDEVVWVTVEDAEVVVSKVVINEVVVLVELVEVVDVVVL
jgi:hypothetical protein